MPAADARACFASLARDGGGSVQRQSKRRVPGIVVIAAVFVLFALVMAWAIGEGRELGLLGAPFLRAG
jgi:hypothetical protein